MSSTRTAEYKADTGLSPREAQSRSLRPSSREEGTDPQPSPPTKASRNFSQLAFRYPVPRAPSCFL